ncbi:CheR family methyltransferase [Methylomonas sp. MgM2]
MKNRDAKSEKNVNPNDTTETLTPVVGIGASAGGLEALEALFANLPADTGLAFIVVTHQLPGHISLLPELLENYTRMPVVIAEDGMPLQADQVFVCPAGKNLALLHRRLHLMEPGEYNANNLPIDYFLRSLAEDIQGLSIGIILSGTGTDGTLGLKAVKGVSGMTMVQEPNTAKFDGMPSSALLQGDVDFVLPAEQLGHQLIKYAKGDYLKGMQFAEAENGVDAESIQKIFVLLRNRTGNDFSAYKPTTIKRRIARRMNIHQIKNAPTYVRFLQENPVEIDKLFKELLINVTNFFRDQEAFDALLDNALPKLLQDKPDNYEFRIWVVGCASGEEAYSLAILFKEAIENAGKAFNFQIFATDLDQSSINRARYGTYPAGIAADVSPQRLERFFTLIDNQYRVNQSLRDRVIFATQNVIQDPPFTHIDLISCRNLLIYLGSELQRTIFPHLFYALNPDGMLFLGSSESLGQFGERFSAIDAKWKIYRKKPGPPVKLPFKVSSLPTSIDEMLAVPFKSLSGEFQPGNIARQIERLLLDRYAPASVIINEHGKIIYIHGRTGNYLEPASGQPNWSILEMAREGLHMPLLTALNKATKTGLTEEIVATGLQVKTNGNFETIDMTFCKINEPEPLRDLYLVAFHPQAAKPEPHPAPVKKDKVSSVSNKDKEKEQLEQELFFTKESLRATIEQLQTSNEEIKSSNEELQSTNEELQSSNEELETSKEEMQSLNEELNAVNSELHIKVEQLSVINDDMQNLMNSTDIATIFLDNQLKIKRFTQQAQSIVKVIDSDIGRSLADLVSVLKYDHLIDDAKAVLRTLVRKDTEVETLAGDWYLLRILPYRTAENMIDGLVITFVDITRLKKAEQTAHAAYLTTAIVNSINQPLIVLDDALRVLTVNRAYGQTFNCSPEQVSGKAFFDIHQAAWRSDGLRDHLIRLLADKQAFDCFGHDAAFPGAGKKRLLINGCILKQLPNSPESILLAIGNAATRS